MATNRMFLKCKGCGKEFLLAKVFDLPYYAPYEKSEMRNAFDVFLKEHAFCDNKNNDVNHLNQFELVYEVEEEEFKM